MDHLKEAKANFTELTSFFGSTASCATYVREELLYMVSFLGDHLKVEDLINSVVDGDNNSSFSLPTLSAESFFQFERNILCIADGILFQTGLREFEMAVALESIRQHALLPLIELSEDVQQSLGINEKSPRLIKHTPRGF